MPRVESSALATTARNHNALITRQRGTIYSVEISSVDCSFPQEAFHILGIDYAYTSNVFFRFRESLVPTKKMGLGFGGNMIQVVFTVVHDIMVGRMRQQRSPAAALAAAAAAVVIT